MAYVCLCFFYEHSSSAFLVCHRFLRCITFTSFISFPPILQKKRKKERKKLCKPHLFRRFCSVNRLSLPFPNNREGSTQVTGKIAHHQRRERQRWLEFRGISQSEVARGYRLKCFHFVSEEEIPWRRFISLPNVSSKKKGNIFSRRSIQRLLSSAN